MEEAYRLKHYEEMLSCSVELVTRYVMYHHMVRLVHFLNELHLWIACYLQIVIAFTYKRSGKLVSCKYRNIEKKFLQVDL